MKRFLVPMAAAFHMLTGPVSASAAETVTYTYDVRGRLVTVSTSGGPANGVTTSTGLDPAGNRITQSTSGVTPPPSSDCTFEAKDVEGNDEFSVNPYIVLTGTCSAAVTVSAAVQHISGQGNYNIYPGSANMTFQPGDPAHLTSKWIRISAYYGSVPAGNPLKLQVNWTITSGSGSIIDSSSLVTIYNSDCYC